MAQDQGDLKAELEALKAQVYALTKAQEECAEAAATEEEAPAAAFEIGGVPLGNVTVEFDELFEQLKAEVEDLHPLTCLAVFGLGVLVGRLLTN